MGRARAGACWAHGAAHADTDRAARLDCRPLADGRRRHHDFPCRSDGWSGDDGRHLGERLAVGGRTRGHHPSPAGVRPRHRSGREYRHGGRARHRRRRRRPCLYQRRIGTARRAVARLRSVAQRIADTAHDRRQARLGRQRRILPACEQRLPRRCRAPASTIIAAGSIACATWRRPWSSSASPF